MKAVGARLPRYDGIAHVTGRTKYVADQSAPGMLACKGLRSPHHSARIVSIDTSKAEKHPGVFARRRRTRTCRRTSSATSRRSASRPTSRTWPSDEVRYKGQLIGGVAAIDEATALEALDLIDVKYEVREPFLDIRKAFDPGPAAADRQGQRLLLRPLRPPQGDEGRRRRGLREGRRDRQGLVPPERDRAGPDRAAGLPRRARERRPADRLHLHAGHVLHDGRARRAPPALARQHQARRRHRRRRLRRQGRLRHRAAGGAARAQDPRARCAGSSRARRRCSAAACAPPGTSRWPTRSPRTAGSSAARC